MSFEIKIKRILITFLLLIHACYSLASDIEQPKQYSGVNNISFYDSKYNKNFAGNGFLITYQKRLYAVTVKHVLLEVKTPTMNSVSIAEHINSWKIHPNNEVDNFVILGKLLNKDISEKIDITILTRDWLVFEVNENKSNLEVLELRETPLKIGETLIAYGCSYASRATCTMNKYKGILNDFDSENLRITIPRFEPKKMRGLSGSPVLDENGFLVGIVSNVLKNKNNDGFDFAPATLNYIKKVLTNLKNK